MIEVLEIRSKNFTGKIKTYISAIPSSNQKKSNKLTREIPKKTIFNNLFAPTQTRDDSAIVYKPIFAISRAKNHNKKKHILAQNIESLPKI